MDLDGKGDGRNRGREKCNQNRLYEKTIFNKQIIVTMVNLMLYVFYYCNNDENAILSALPTTGPLFLVSFLALDSH